MSRNPGTERSRRVLSLIRLGDHFTFERRGGNGAVFLRVARMVSRQGCRILAVAVPEALLTVKGSRWVAAGNITHIGAVPIDQYKPRKAPTAVYVHLDRRPAAQDEILLGRHFGDLLASYIGPHVRLRSGGRMLTLDEAIKEAREAAGGAQ